MLFVALSIALYNKAFTPVVDGHAARPTSVGNQLQPGADVKVRGLIVGEVRPITRRPATAPSWTWRSTRTRSTLIPANVTARLLPKTLFGERYVAWCCPQQPDAGTLDGRRRHRAGPQPASAIELEQVLDDLLPVLQAVQPEKLATTLTALSHGAAGPRQASSARRSSQLDALPRRAEPAAARR